VPQAYQLVGSANGDSKKIEQAKILLDQVLANDPKNPVALFLRGWSFQQSGRPLDAIKTYETLHPEISQLSGYAHFNEGVLLEHLRRNDESIAHYQMSIAANPALTDAWRRLISLLIRIGDIEAAKGTTLSALQAIPNDTEVLNFKAQLGIKD
jgi:tetratricopeptide (TPR) repeat protein